MVTRGSDDRFDWSNDESVVVEHQSALAVYQNQSGDVVIRQERSWDEDQDTHVVITKESLPQIIDALRRFAERGEQ